MFGLVTFRADPAICTPENISPCYKFRLFRVLVDTDLLDFVEHIIQEARRYLEFAVVRFVRQSARNQSSRVAIRRARSVNWWRSLAETMNTASLSFCIAAASRVGPSD